MTNQYYCCQAPYVIDACGICGGSSDSCGTVLTCTITADAKRRSLLAPLGAEDVEAALKDIVVEQLSYPADLVNCTAAPSEAGFEACTCLPPCPPFDCIQMCQEVCVHG